MALISLAGIAFEVEVVERWSWRMVVTGEDDWGSGIVRVLVLILRAPIRLGDGEMW